MKKRSGQILILVLLVVVVVLAIGLSVASRNLTNLRTTVQTEQSQRAFNAAEGGVEDILSRGQAEIVNLAATGNPVTVTVGDIQANVSVKSFNEYEAIVEEGTVAQVDLSGYVGTATLEWILQSNPTENDVSADPAFSMASLEVSFVCQSPTCLTTVPSGCTPSGAVGSFSQMRCAYKAEDISGQEGFSQCTANPPGDKYLCRAPTFTINASDNAKVVRIRPFWGKATVRVSGSPSLPVQAYDVVSTATTPDLGITRRVQVTRTVLPQLPASFDYVLFSETDIVK